MALSDFRPGPECLLSGQPRNDVYTFRMRHADVSFTGKRQQTTGGIRYLLELRSFPDLDGPRAEFISGPSHPAALEKQMYYALKTAVLGLAIFATIPSAAFAQVSRSPCAVVCPFGGTVNPKTCSCEKPSAPSFCALVCFDPQKLDAARCRCVKQ